MIQPLEEISVPEVIAVQEPKAVAPTIRESLDVLALTVTEVLVGVVAE